MSMTENEAIVQLNFDMEMIRFNPETGETLTLEQIEAQNEANYKTYLADEMAITALIENQQYKAIGTVEELRSMKENGAFSGIELAQIAAMQMKLKAYVDAEEQGLLLRLPCKVGDTVYVIGSLSEFGVTEKIELEVFECVVNRITLNYKYGNTMQMDCKNHSSFGWSMNMKKFNELVFLTKEEAEQALAEMQGK